MQEKRGIERSALEIGFLSVPPLKEAYNVALPSRQSGNPLQVWTEGQDNRLSVRVLQQTQHKPIDTTISTTISTL
jgi:hypothetical protein